MIDDKLLKKITKMIRHSKRRENTVVDEYGYSRTIYRAVPQDYPVFERIDNDRKRSRASLPSKDVLLDSSSSNNSSHRGLRFRVLGGRERDRSTDPQSTASGSRILSDSKVVRHSLPPSTESRGRKSRGFFGRARGKKTDTARPRHSMLSSPDSQTSRSQTSRMSEISEPYSLVLHGAWKETSLNEPLVACKSKDD